MPAIATFIPFLLMLFHYQLYDLYYGADSDTFSIYTAQKQGTSTLTIKLMWFDWFFLYIFATGYESATLYAEAESRLFLANSSDSSNYLYINEVKVFLNINDSRQYFKFEETARAIRVTTNKSEATFFTLKTTPELHRLGQFQLLHASNSDTDGSGFENQTFNELVMKRDLDSDHLTEDGPFKLIPNSEQCRTVIHFEIHGKSTTLPELC